MPETDSIDRIITQWARERPDLDTSGFAIVGRIMVLAKLLEKQTEEALAPLGLKLWAFDVLATLRRQGEPYTLTPTELSQATMLTSGAMTNRLDRLEERGLIRREQDPNDRRGVRIVLTEAGKRRIDRGVEARFKSARRIARSIGRADARVIEAQLRRILAEFR